MVYILYDAVYIIEGKPVCEYFNRNFHLGVGLWHRAKFGVEQI